MMMNTSKRRQEVNKTAQDDINRTSKSDMKYFQSETKCDTEQ